LKNPVVQVIAVVQSPFTRACAAVQPHFPLDNVNDGLQAVHEPVVTAHVVQFPAHGLHAPDP